MVPHRLRTLVSILNLNGYRCCHIYNLMHDVKTAMYIILKSRLKYVWCCENFNIRYGEMVLERLQSIFCISSVTKQNVLHYPTLRMKVGLEINLGCLIHPL